MTTILTHRGLDPSRQDYYTESSLEAFKDHLSRGFGLEADLCFTKDGIIFCHDSTLERLTRGQDERPIKGLTSEEACAAKIPRGRLASFEEVMNLLRQHPQSMIATHFKGPNQNSLCCDRLLTHLRPFKNFYNQIFIFDLALKTARYLKQKEPEINLAPSVCHSYDIERFQMAAHGTLTPLEQVLEEAELFSWVWLDEWDLMDRRVDGTVNRRGKKLYTQEVFDRVRNKGLKIALVTPELHATSPGLLGSESHPDGSTEERLLERMEEILSLAPDAICTDYPDQAAALLCTLSS